MNLIDILQNSRYIYSTKTKLGLKKYVCKVNYYTTEELDDLSYVICSILNSREGKSISTNALGIMLGFCVSQVGTEEHIKVYRDEAEIKLFEGLLEQIADEHLIRIANDFVYLTKLGMISLENKRKYHFYTATQCLYEHLTLKHENEEELEMYPFFKDLGVFCTPSEGKIVWPEDDLIESIIYGDVDSLVERIHLQSKEQKNIYNAEISQYYEMANIHCNISLYQNVGGYLPIFMNGNQKAWVASEYLQEEDNSLLKERLVQECLFKKFWDDENSVLDYRNLKPYEDLINFEELSKDRRTVWTDNDLWELVSAHATPTCWKSITLCCPIEVLFAHVDECCYDYDWEELTRRVDDQFLIDNFKNNPWDLEILSNDQGRDISVIENLILQQKDTEEDWDWDVLGNILSKEFVFNHLDVVGVNLSNYTQDDAECRNAILSHPEKEWEWEKIEREFSIDFFYENMQKIHSYLTYNHFFDRVFKDKEWADKFARSNDFCLAIKENTLNNGVLSSLSLNDADIIWDSQVIDTFIELGLISWDSTTYIKGFECNPYIKWDKEIFDLYHNKINSQDGYTQVSRSIDDYEIVESNDFNWDNYALSSNPNIVVSESFLSSEHTVWRNILDVVEDTSAIERIDGIQYLIGDDEEAWNFFSKKADVEFVKKNYKFPWNWSILTTRKLIKDYSKLDHPYFADKWDWSYLTANIDIETVKQHINKYKEYWDWSILFERLGTQRERLIPERLEYWASLLSSIKKNAARKNAWSAFTALFTFKELKELLVSTRNKKGYWWDIEYYCNHDDFYVFTDISGFETWLDWDALSSSSKIDGQLYYERDRGISEKKWNDQVRKLFQSSKNKWNFNLLSNFRSLNSQYWFLANYKDKLDWNTITRESTVFSSTTDKEQLYELIYQFQNYISFEILSYRKDVDIDQVRKAFPGKSYDFNALIKQGVLKVTLLDVEQYNEYDWDWQLVSSAPTFLPSADFLKKHINDNLNWFSLSRRDIQSVWSDSKLMIKLANNKDIRDSIDWKCVSSNTYFPVTSDLYDLIDAEKLNWDYLSKKKAIVTLPDRYYTYFNWSIISHQAHTDIKDLDFLEKYKDYLDWNIICNRRNFCFSNEVIERFADYIDWQKASGSIDIDFSEDFVAKYHDRWNWSVLLKNKAYYNTIRNTEISNTEKENAIRFIRQFPEDVIPLAYHFTHMSNAIRIIREMKLQSRNQAEGEFDNSAGSNVTRRSTAHDYARFYFLSQSPTQFYNESLGWDSHMQKKYYSTSYKLGLPKCPLPVFFVLDIEEVVMAMPDRCYYSNGNMQKDSAKCYKLVDNPNKLNVNGLYRNPKKETRQQEFLVKDYVDFTNLKNISIFCFNEQQKNLLKEAVKGSPLASRIAIVDGIHDPFIRKNRTLEIEEKDEILTIRTDYSDEFELKVEYDYENQPIVVNKDNIKSQRSNCFYVRGYLEIDKSVPFNVYFEVKKPREGSWKIYSNKKLWR